MAALNCCFSSPSSISVANGATKTIAQITAPTNQRARLQSVAIFGDSNTPTLAGVEFRLYRQTTAGTPAGAGTPTVVNGGTETPRVTCAFGAYSAEPNNGAVIGYGKFNPQAGYMLIYPMGQEPIIPGDGRVGIVAINNSGASVGLTFEVKWEE